MFYVKMYSQNDSVLLPSEAPQAEWNKSRLKS